MVPRYVGAPAATVLFAMLTTQLWPRLDDKLNRVSFEKRSFCSLGSRWSLTQKRSATTKGSRFRRASKPVTDRVGEHEEVWGRSRGRDVTGIDLIVVG